MEIDIIRHLGAVQRGVHTRDHEGAPARVVTASRSYPTSVEDLWDAVTRADRLPRWFLPVSGDLKPGGRYQLEGNAGGEILQCDAPRHLSVTWEFAGVVSWLEVRISDAPDGGARLELEHLAREDEHWTRFGPGAAGVGWDMALMGLGEHLSGAPAVDPQAAMAWMGSSEGRDFMERSAGAWGEADRAAGTPPDQARDAVAQTLAAYTGEEG